MDTKVITTTTINLNAAELKLVLRALIDKKDRGPEEIAQGLELARGITEKIRRDSAERVGVADRWLEEIEGVSLAEKKEKQT